MVRRCVSACILLPSNSDLTRDFLVASRLSGTIVNTIVPIQLTMLPTYGRAIVHLIGLMPGGLRRWYFVPTDNSRANRRGGRESKAFATSESVAGQQPSEASACVFLLVQGPSFI